MVGVTPWRSNSETPRSVSSRSQARVSAAANPKRLRGQTKTMVFAKASTSSIRADGMYRWPIDSRCDNGCIIVQYHKRYWPTRLIYFIHLRPAGSRDVRTRTGLGARVQFFTGPDWAEGSKKRHSTYEHRVAASARRRWRWSERRARLRRRPRANVLVIMGTTSATRNINRPATRGTTGYRTPNIERTAKEVHLHRRLRASSLDRRRDRPSPARARSAPAAQGRTAVGERGSADKRPDAGRAAEARGLRGDGRGRQEPSRRPQRIPAR